MHAGVVVPAHDRARLERVLPLCAATAAGRRSGAAHRRWRHRRDPAASVADGTTHLRFDPVELLERLAAVTPRPRINLVLYYGVDRWMADFEKSPFRENVRPLILKRTR